MRHGSETIVFLTQCLVLDSSRVESLNILVLSWKVEKNTKLTCYQGDFVSHIFSHKYWHIEYLSDVTNKNPDVIILFLAHTQLCRYLFKEF